MKKIGFWLLISAIVFCFISVVASLYYVVVKSCGKVSFERCLSLRQKYGHLIQTEKLKKIYFKSADNINLLGLLYSPSRTKYQNSEPKKILIVIHGYKQAKECLLPLIKLFPDYIIFFIDLRAHGESGGNRISFGYHEAKDIIGAVSYLEHEFNIKKNSPESLKLYGLGFSMGAVSLLHAAYLLEKNNKQLFSAVILDSGFCSLKKQLNKVFTKKTSLPNWFFPLACFIYNQYTHSRIQDVLPIEWIKDLHIPVFLIHQKDDWLISSENAFLLYKVLGQNNTQNNTQDSNLWMPECKGHAKSYILEPQEYTKRVNNFINKIEKAE